MSIIEALTLFGIMALLAAIPSASVALVVTRSATSGIGNGVAVAAGIVLGDLLFVALAIFGLSVVAEAMGSLFMLIKLLGAGYLIWLGLSMFRKRSKTKLSPGDVERKGGLVVSFLSGLFLTLGDVKAVFFYVSLFPMFVGTAALQAADVIAIVLVTMASVGGVKVIYALSATKIASLAEGLELENAARTAAGGIMVGAGGYILAKA